MPRKESPEDLLRKHLGPEGGDAVLKRIDEMVAAGEKPAAIEEAVTAEIATQIENVVLQTLVVKIGPMEPIKIEPIQVSIKPAIKPTPLIKVNSGLTIKIGPASEIKVGPTAEIKTGPGTIVRPPG